MFAFCSPRHSKVTVPESAEFPAGKDYVRVGLIATVILTSGIEWSRLELYIHDNCLVRLALATRMENEHC